MNIDYALIGKRIKEARKEKHYTQDVLAEKLDVSIGYVSQLERGITKISLDLLGAIAGILEQDMAYFLDAANVTANNYLFSDVVSLFSALSVRDKQLAIEFLKLLSKRD